MSPDEPLSLSKAKMVRRANMLVVQLGIAPVIYLIVAVLLAMGNASFATSQSFVLRVFLVMVLFSLVTIVATVWVMTGGRLMLGGSRFGPIGRAFQIMSIGAVLAIAQAVYGLVLTFLSGSIFYLVGFSLVAWASLWWVRKRFKQILGSLPDT
jgi:hypothetical protein